MLFCRIDFQLFILFQIFWIFCAYGKLIPTTNDWYEINENWPVLKNEITKDFFYFKSNSTLPTSLTVKIKDSIKLPDLQQNQSFIFSFKYWQSPKADSLMVSVKYDHITDVLSKKFYDRGSIDWMEQKYSLTKDQINTFKISVYINAPEYVISIKDLKFEYDLITNDSIPSHKMEIPVKLFSTDYSSSTEDIHSTENTLDDCSLNNMKPNCFEGPDWVPKTMEVTLREFDTKDYCFDLEYSSIDPAIIEAYYIIANNKLENKFFSTKVNIMVATETARLCLSDYLKIKAKNITVFFTANHIYKANKVNIKLRINYSERTRPSSPVYTYLPSTYSEWKKTSNIGVQFIEKTITVNKVSSHPANFRISSDWIKYDNMLSAIDMIYSIKVAKPEDIKIFDLIRIMPKICDEISYCFDTKIIGSDYKDTDQTRNYKYNLNANLTNTQYIKLVFDFEYFSLKNEKIEFEFENLHFGDPCFNRKSSGPNFEKCESNQFNSKPNYYTPKCLQKWTGLKCDIPNPCWVFDPAKPTEHSGEKKCSKYGKTPNKHGLCTLDSNYKVKCICENDDKINWSGRDCVEPEPTITTGWEKIADGYILNNKTNKLSFEFKEILSEKYDVCINFEYTSKVLYEIKVTYNETNDIKTSIYFNPSKTTDTLCVNDFNFNHDPNFKLNFEVLNVQDKSLKTKEEFSIKNIKFSVKPKKLEPSKLFIRNNIDRQINPDLSPNSFAFEGTQNKDNEIKYKLQTDWIELSPELKNSSKYNNHISLTLDDPEQFSLSAYIIYMDKNMPKIKQNPLSKQAKTKITLSLPDIGPFKVIVLINVLKADNKNFNATIDEISIGNPCSVNPCGGKINCTPTTFETFKCAYNNDACSNNICDSCPTLIQDQSVTKTEACRATGEDTYDCDVFDTYFTYKSKICTQKFAYNSTVLKCNGKNCNFFDNLSLMKYSNARVPQYNGTLNYFTMTDGSPLSIGIENYDAKKDHCLTINYTISNKSSLSINLDDNKPIAFTQLNYNDKVPSFDNHNQIDICLSDLAKTVKPKSSVNIVPKLANNESFVLVEIKDKNDQDFSQLPYLMRKVIYKKEDKYWTEYHYKDQWSFKSPTDSWTVNDDGSIDYKTQKNSIYPLITSNWIEKYESGLQLRFSIEYISKSIPSSHLQIIALDDKLSQIQIASKDISNKDTNQSIYFEIKPEIKTAFKIGIRVSYTENPDKPEHLFKIKDIDIGDPCIESDGKNTPNYCQDVGYCRRLNIVTNYTCQCNQGRSGIDCEKIDYCNSSLQSTGNKQFSKYTGTGDDYCKEKSSNKCHPGGIMGFYCDCGKDQFWDPGAENCSDLKCLSLGCNSISQFCNSTSAKCECKDKFKVDPKNPDNCLKIDPCDDKKKCNREVQQNTICISSLDTLDYSCVCSFGYEKTGDKDEIKCESKMCDSPILNNCEQFCVPDDKSGFNCTCDSSYDEKDNKCLKKKDSDCKKCTGDAFCVNGQTQCQCKHGYKLNGNKCEPELNAFTDPSICPGEIKYNQNTSNWDCDCGTGFKWDEKNKTCSLNKICSTDSDARKTCTAKNALCQINLEKLSPECVCPSGLYWKNNTKCVPFCDLDDGLSSACSEINAICDPIYIADKPNDVIKNIDSKKPFCKCNPGYYFDGHNCLIGQSVVKFTFEFKNNFEQDKSNQIQSIKELLSDNLKKSSFYDSIQKEILSTIAENSALNDKLTQPLQLSWTNQMILEQAQLIVNKTNFYKYKSFSISSCKLNKDFYNCEFILDLGQHVNLTDKDIFKDISEPSFCIPIPDQQDYCVIPGVMKTTFYYTAVGQTYPPIVINKKALSPSKYIAPCTDLSVNCDGYSHCVPDTKSTGYSCVCGKDFKSIKVSPKFGQKEAYECQVDTDSLCNAKCPGLYKDGYCTAQVSSDKKEVIARCGCKQNFKLINNETQCIDACDGVKCSSNGKCQYSGYNGYQCVCNEGYYGETCDKEQTLSKGGWIAGIVVLAVLVVIVSGVAFMFARRSRGGSQPETGRPMDDFTGSSYRVPSQSRGQSNPSFN